MEKLNIHQIYDLLQAFYGHKCSMVQLSEEEKEIRFILYDAFQISCDINDRYERYGIGLYEGYTGVIAEFFGEGYFLNNDRESIKHSFQVVDDYCRASLPDKFLKAYDEAYLSKPKKKEYIFAKMKKMFQK